MRWPPGARLGGASYALKPEPAGPRSAAGMTLIGRTWFRILAQWLRRMMNCSVAGRGHRRSWSLPGTASRTCCAGSVTSGTDPGTPGCPGSSPPGIPSGTATTWSASAPMRCGAWRTLMLTPGCRAACWAATAGSGRGPRPALSREALTIPGRSPGMTRSGGSASSGGTPDTERACWYGLLYDRFRRGSLRRGRMPVTMRTGSLAGVNEQPCSKSTCQGVWQEHEPARTCEMSIWSICISMCGLEYSLTLSPPCRRSPCSLFPSVR